MKNLYIPDVESREDCRMWKIIDLLTKHKQILELTAAGHTTEEIGKKMFKSARTVEVYIHGMIKAVVANNKTELVAIALRLKIIE